MTVEEKITRVDKYFNDLNEFIAKNEYKYAASNIRFILEIILNTYIDYYFPEGISYFENIINNKKKDKAPTTMELLNALSSDPRFPKEQLSILHQMRKIGNEGSHEGDEYLTNDHIRIHVSAIIPQINEEICVWKDFIQHGHTDLFELNKEKQAKRIHGTIDYPSNIVITTLVVSLVGIASIVFFTINTTIDFIQNSVTYDAKYIWVWYLSLIVFFVLAFYCRKFGSLHKIIFNIGILYFVLPRAYQVFWCFTNGSNFFSMIIYFFIAGFITTAYCILVLQFDNRQGGLVGYN
ncbi:MAG: DUF4145 domain-containing protein [Lachnospiraceae bacterium]|nr:DUF4145 domain-containing protein [Lachnospiraceae bacterium]